MDLFGILTALIVVNLINLYKAGNVTLLDTKKNGWRDWTKNTDNSVGWRIQNLPPNGDAVYGVCEIQEHGESSSNSWLLSPFIRRRQGVLLFAQVSFTMRKCDQMNFPVGQQCNETFMMLKYESDYEADDIEYTNTFFKVVKTIFPDRKWQNKDRTEDILNTHTFQLSVRRAGVVLAFPNTGSCVMVKEVVVYYRECPEFRINFVVFQRTASFTKPQFVTGKCVEGATQFNHLVDTSTTGLTNYCLSGGSWKFVSLPLVCHCSAGHQPDHRRSLCLKCDYAYYKPHSGSQNCRPCPSNSYSTTGSSKCYCNTGFYNVPTSTMPLNCRPPPPKPSSINIDVSDQARVQMHWMPPNLKQSYKYNVSCVNCPNKVQFDPGDQVSLNRVTIFGTLPSKEYNFKVTTINEVSRYINIAFDIEQSSRKISVLTTPLDSFVNVEIVSIKRQSQFINVQWKPTKDAFTILEYECVLFAFSQKQTRLSIRFPDYQKHIFTDKRQTTFNIHNIPATTFLTKVRCRNKNGWGRFTDLKRIINNKDNNIIEEKIRQTTPVFIMNTSSRTIYVSSSFSSQLSIVHPDNNNAAVVPEKDTILVIVLAILVVIILFIFGTIIICRIKRQKKFDEYGQKSSKMKKYESQLNNPTMYSSGTYYY